MTRLRVAVIGGGIGRAHIEEGYVRNADLFEVRILCDLDPARLAAVGDEFQIPERLTDFDAVLAREDIDIVDICTPPALHKPMVLAALAAGKHVICEKPLTGSLADADEIITAEKTARGRLMPIFQYRFGDGAMRARRIIESGLAGKAYVGTAETFWTRTAAYYDNPWRGRWATELGGVLMTHAIHIHDLVPFLMGPVSRVFARMATRVNPIEVEDCVSASFALASGALFSSTSTLGSRKEESRLHLAFENVTLESIHAPYALGDGPWRISPATRAIGREIKALLADMKPVGRRFEGQFAAFHDALVNGTELPVTTADARRSLELATALYHSASSGRDVALPIGANHPNYRSWRP